MVDCSVCLGTNYRAQNNGQSTDNVRPNWGFDQSNVHLAGHVDQTQCLVTFIVILLKLSKENKIAMIYRHLKLP